MIVDVYDNMTVLDNMFGGSFEFNSFGFASVNILLTTAVSTVAAILFSTDFQRLRYQRDQHDWVGQHRSGRRVNLRGSNNWNLGKHQVKSTLLTSTVVNPDNLGPEEWSKTLKGTKKEQWLLAFTTEVFNTMKDQQGQINSFDEHFSCQHGKMIMSTTPRAAIETLLYKTSEVHVVNNNGNTWILVSWCPNRRQQEFRMGNQLIGFFNRGYQHSQLQLECGNKIRLTTDEKASIQIWENNVMWSYNMFSQQWRLMDQSTTTGACSNKPSSIRESQSSPKWQMVKATGFSTCWVNITQRSTSTRRQHCQFMEQRQWNACVATPGLENGWARHPTSKIGQHSGMHTTTWGMSTCMMMKMQPTPLAGAIHGTGETDT